jgi:4-amino-4-deoxy-L-arabinose transferase-like glycosyltransferase
MRAHRSLFVYTALVFVAAFAWFSFRASHAMLASGFVDPVARYGAQDEATYSRIALETMARGNWLVPTFLDRIAFFKPPLLFWLDGIGMRLFGASVYVLRLPALLSGAAVCAVAFYWVARERGRSAALLAVALIATGTYWIMLASLNMMDAPLAAFSFLGLYAIARDPALSPRQTLPVAALVFGAALLLKSVAALPVIAAGILCALVRRAQWRRIAGLIGGIAVISAPWYLYALLSHFQWFWNEHVRTELFGHNVAGTALGSPLGNLSFYFTRLVRVDPLVAVTGAVSIIFLSVKRDRSAVLVLLFLSLSGLVMLIFGYHAATYLLPVVTGLAILTGLAIPRPAAIPVLLIVLIGNFFVLTRGHYVIWKGSNLPMAPALVSYCELHRPSPLFLIEADDEFYSAALPLPRVHYGLIAHGRAAVHLAIDFERLGIVTTADEFDNQPRYWPTFRARLTTMGLPRDLDPRATEVLFPSVDAIKSFIPRHPEIDFLVPDRLALSTREHVASDAGSGFLLLFATQAGAAESTAPRPSSWSCKI